ncbi:hypothetical protein HYH02_007029 [Chlamydomonas schloesseri]|uniref:Cytochrome b561 domain-containing protein n=1 Tax=Chlamydomonas schloesseri TaxID=2026947 RepID=A0A835WIF2_9CHLO|nr:hypothetical protein HYH02_007029 [Chlamydomonas schloesseri]|eukprot:KAG2448001.1 hypothetical protein HYH02_007029 [Chlamydomonas schloesseri]
MIPSMSAASLAANCTPSTLGYACMRQQGEVTVHWSANTASAPVNPCTPATPTVLTAAQLMSSGSLHMAVQGYMGGYVAISFAGSPGTMCPADTVLGWADSAGSSQPGFIGTFHVTERLLDDSNRLTGAADWAYDKGVMQEGSVTTICFSRRLLEPRAPTSPDLRATIAGLMPTSASSTSSSSEPTALSTAGGAQPQPLGLNWAVASWDALREHYPRNRGGFYLDLTAGAAAAAADNEWAEQRRGWVIAHGVLMTVAWVLLLPVGPMFPAHRWLLRGAAAPPQWYRGGGKQWWFLGHVTCQWVGFGMAVAAFGIGHSAHVHERGRTQSSLIPPGGAAKAHNPLGNAVMITAFAQILLAHATRPAPDAGLRRRVWEWAHWVIGRCLIGLAWAQVIIGAHVAAGEGIGRFWQWAGPMVGMMAALVIADMALRVAGWRWREPATPLDKLSAATDADADRTEKQPYVEVGKGAGGSGDFGASGAQAAAGGAGAAGGERGLGEPLVGLGRGTGHGRSSTTVAEGLARSRPTSASSATVASVAEA